MKLLKKFFRKRMEKKLKKLEKIVEEYTDGWGDPSDQPPETPSTSRAIEDINNVIREMLRSLEEHGFIPRDIELRGAPSELVFRDDLPTTTYHPTADEPGPEPLMGNPIPRSHIAIPNPNRSERDRCSTVAQGTREFELDNRGNIFVEGEVTRCETRIDNKDVVMNKEYPHKCFKCHKPILYVHCFDNAWKKHLEELMKDNYERYNVIMTSLQYRDKTMEKFRVEVFNKWWTSNFVEFYCCTCYKRLNNPIKPNPNVRLMYKGEQIECEIVNWVIRRGHRVNSSYRIDLTIREYNNNFREIFNSHFGNYLHKFLTFVILEGDNEFTIENLIITRHLYNSEVCDELCVELEQYRV